VRPKIPRHLTSGSNLLLKCLESFSVHPDRTSVLVLNRSQKLSVVLIVIFLCSSHDPQSFRQCPQIQSQFFRVILTSSACPKEHGSTERPSSNPSPVHFQWCFDLGSNRDFKITTINISNTVTSRVQIETRNVGGGILPQPSNKLENTLFTKRARTSKSFQTKVFAKPKTTRIGFFVFQRSRSGGPDTVPSTAYEQQSETPVNMTHILQGRLWTQWRIQNSACRRFTTSPSASRRRQTPNKKLIKEKGWVGGTKNKVRSLRRENTAVIPPLGSGAAPISDLLLRQCIG
jgi:hypothetical protein